MSQELDALHDIEIFLKVAENRLECLKDYGYIEPCDATTLLESHIKLALGVAQEEVRRAAEGAT